MAFLTTTHSTLLFSYPLQFNDRDDLQTNTLPLRELDIYICLSLWDSHRLKHTLTKSLPFPCVRADAHCHGGAQKREGIPPHTGMLPLWFWLCSHVLLGQGKSGHNMLDHQCQMCANPSPIFSVSSEQQPLHPASQPVVLGGDTKP